MAPLSRHQRVIIALSVRILLAGVVGTSKRRVDSIEVRLALRCLLPHCPERWPLELYWDAAGQVKLIAPPSHALSSPRR